MTPVVYYLLNYVCIHSYVLTINSYIEMMNHKSFVHFAEIFSSYFKKIH